MSRTTRVRVLSQPLVATLTRAQAVMACDVGTLYCAAAMIAAGQPITSDQVATLNAVRDVLGLSEVITTSPVTLGQGRTLAARSVAAIADSTAVEQRHLIASTLVNALKAENWTVTVIDGGAPDRYTGIEATRGTEHLVAAVGPGELIADHAGAHDGSAIVDCLTQGLREVGCAVSVDDDSGGPDDGQGGTLFSLRGAPTRAHAIQASLRHEVSRTEPAKRRTAPPGIRLIAG